MLSDRGEIFRMVWEQLSDAAGAGEYSRVVSLGVRPADEAASDCGLSAVGAYFDFGFYSNPGEV